MVTCPKCGTKLQTRSQLLDFHDITCPVCASRLEVKKSSRIIGAAIVAPLAPILVVLSWLFPRGYYPVIFGVVALFDFFLLYIFYRKSLKFKLKNPNFKDHTIPKPNNIQ